jgi:hypothetical protein
MTTKAFVRAYRVRTATTAAWTIFVLYGSDAERPLSAIRLRYVLPA